ncbi:protoglobin domain-containing protein [Cytobacillus sp. FJAT-53684]|uniref:Protoglobin domain-containing protein n=1 Tax=Cytobacillus mangrovibacter TaxID=3299024 RepID=A0ABW6JZ94_9BACI
MSNTLDQEKIEELVDRFYSKLTKDSYYSVMFAERGVDIELLKSRQRSFISRLISDDSPADDEQKVKQVNDRHPFQTTPERAGIWMSTMEETINEMEIEESIKLRLLKKIGSLVDHLINK